MRGSPVSYTMCLYSTCNLTTHSTGAASGGAFIINLFCRPVHAGVGCLSWFYCKNCSETKRGARWTQSRIISGS